MASPSVLAMMLTTQNVDGLPLYRFEKVLGRHGVDIPRQTLARGVIQCCEHLQSLLNLMRYRLLDSPVILIDYTTSRAQEVPLHLLESYRGYVITDDYAGYNALALQPGVERLARMPHVRRKFVNAQKVQPKGNVGRADVALAMIKKLYGIGRNLKDANDEQQFVSCQEKSLPVLAQLKSWLEKRSNTSPHKVRGVKQSTIWRVTGVGWSVM